MFFSLNLEKTKKKSRKSRARRGQLIRFFCGLYPRITQKSHSKTLDFHYVFLLFIKKKNHYLLNIIFIMYFFLTFFVKLQL
jgi:hypothetical protein